MEPPRKRHFHFTPWIRSMDMGWRSGCGHVPLNAASDVELSHTDTGSSTKDKLYR